MPDASPDTLDYARRPSSGARLKTWGMRIALALLVLVVFAAALPFAANAYASSRYDGLRPGMARAEVERHLWAFAAGRRVNYQGAGAGQFVIRYEFLWLGKFAAIQVVYDADGTARDPQPIFNN